ncbi:MAG: hypothetical protein WDZ84_11710 [Rhodovibrionaceae bacterium]
MRDRLKQSGAIEVSGEADLGRLPPQEIAELAAAAETLAEVARVLAKTGDNVVGELLRGTETFYEWDHYPAGDVFDSDSNSQYYYHAHPPGQRFAGEHGHFHTFLRPRGMPRGIKPAPQPAAAPLQDPNDALSHLVAVAMDARGLPIRLFTTNRWVTGEVWYRAEDVCRMLPRFSVDHAQPSWPVNRWITALVTLFRPQIVALLRARDAALHAYDRRVVPPDVFEDRGLEIVSYAEIVIEAQIETLRSRSHRRRS